MDCDFCICLPIFCGCPTTVKPDGDPTSRMCPRCNNASVYQAKSRTWIELCCVPIIPMNSERIWACSICQWQVPIQQGGWEPALPGSYAPPGQWGPPGGGHGPPGGAYGQGPVMQPPQAYQSPQQSGYYGR